jgi:N-acyl homoserine lactone hydrolase
VSLPSGPVLLAGDAVVHRAWLDSDDVQRIASDPDRAADVRNQVRAFLRAHPDAVLAPGHDTSMLPHDREDIVLHHVEWFDAKAWPLPE